MGTTNDWDCSFMSKDEYNNSITNPIGIIQKAESKINQLNKQIESNLAKQTTESTNSQQLYQQLEKEFLTSKKDVETLGKQNINLQNEIKQLNSKNQNFYEESLKLKSNSIEKDSKSNTISKLYDELQNDKSNLLQIIERKEKDLKQESETVSKLTEKLNEFIKEKSELKSKLIALENDQSSNEYQITRLKQEVNELRKQNDQLDEINKKQTLNFYNEVKELKSINLELRLKNESSLESIDRLNQISNQQKEKIEQLENQLYQAKSEIQRVKSEKMESNGQFESELEVQKRLVALLKENNDDFSKKISFLQGQIDQFKESDRRLKKEHEDAYKKMEDAYEGLQGDYQKVIKEYEDYKSSIAHKQQPNVDISQLDIPILSENVKNRLKETSDLGSREDIRRELLDMVQRYEDLTKLALKEKKQRRNTQEQLNFVLSEIEKKTPIINEQHRDYQRILKSQEKILNSYQEIQAQKDAANLKISTITTENNKIKVEVKDLQKQISHLLKEILDNSNATAGGVSVNNTFGVSQLFGKSVSNNVSISQSISGSQSESDQIIPDSLITFSNIEELQIKNQELLRDTRKLRQEIVNHKESDKKLEWALKELDLLKSSRERQTDMIDSLVKQKEHWRSVAQTSNSSVNPMNENNYDNMEPMSINDLNKSTNRPTSTIFGQSHQQQHQSSSSLHQSLYGEHYEDLKKSFHQLQKEYEQTTKERQTSERESFIKNEQLKNDNTSLKISLSQSDSEKTISLERLKLTSDTLKNQTSELDSYKKKCDEYTKLLLNHQQSISDLQNKISRLEDLRSQAETRLNNIKGENELLRVSESRLLETNRSINLEKVSIETLLERVNQLNSSKESSESELRKRMENEVVQLEQSRLSLRKELDQEKQQLKETQVTLSHQLNESRERYEKREKELSDAKDQILKLKISEQNLISKVSSLENQISNSESRINSLLERQSSSQTMSSSESTSGTSSSTTDLDLKLAKSEIESLKETLNQEKENVIHYKSIAISSEADLSKLREEFNKIKMESEEKINQLNQEITKNQELIHEQSLKIEKLENFTTSHQKDIDDVVQAKENLVKEKQGLYDKINQLTQDLQGALQESKTQHNLYIKANQKYESEVLLHAEHIKELPTIRSKLSEALNTIESLNHQKDNFSTEMKEAKTTWLEQENHLKFQIKELEERLKDIKHHNSLLQSQLDTISSKSNQIDKLNQIITSNSSGITSNEETQKVINELKEVIQLQSKEMKILEVRNESLVQESIRLKQMLQHSQIEVENLNKQLLADQENMKNLTVSTWKHQEVLKQLEQMNLYKESNIMLKDETNKLNKKIEDLTEALQEKERKISPITDENRKLSSENQVLHQEIEAQKIEISNWSNKAQKLLNKYQSIDPDEHQKLIEQNENKDNELKTLNVANEEMKKTLEELKKHAKHWKEESKKLNGVKKEKTDIEAQKLIVDQQNETLKKQLEDNQKLTQTNQENYDKQITDIKKKMLIIERSKKVQANVQTELDQLKVELETNKKSLEEKENENTMIKSKLKLFEALKSKIATNNTTTTTTTPTPVTPAIITPTPTPTTVTPMPTDMPKKRLFKKPAPSQLQNLIDSSKQAPTVQPTTTTVTPQPTTTTIISPQPTTTTTVIPQPTTTATIITPQPTTTIIPQPTTTTIVTPQPTTTTITPQPSIFSIFKNSASTIQSPNSPSSISNSPNIFSPSLTSSTTPTATPTIFGTTNNTPIDTKIAEPTLIQPSITEKPLSPETVQPIDQVMEEDEGIIEEDEDEVEEISSQHAVKKLKVDNTTSIPTYDNEEFETDDQTIEELDDSNITNQTEEIEENNNNDLNMVDVDSSNINISTSNLSTSSTTSNTPISTSQEIQPQTPVTPTVPTVQKRRLKKNPLVPVPDNLVSPSQIKKPFAKSSAPTIISKPAPTPTQPQTQEDNNILSPEPQTPTDDTNQ